jgi:Carboxypeptidase regulatory-like domain/TonB-dependent Receptor Plug Domain
MLKRNPWFVAAVVSLLSLPGVASAQGTIAGVAKDTTGAVLPGVTVQAASPALIEGSREVVTDSSGQYSIVNLRPGTYSVTFKLQGFSTYRREDILLEANFTAQVNAEMKVGEVAESITVSGETPVVDVKSAAQQQVLTRQIITELPAVRVIDRQAAMLPGVLNVIPAGAALTGSGTAATSIRGSATGDSKWLINGMPIVFGTSAGGSQQALNDAGFEQVSVDDGAGSAESALSGARFNIIPKEGGNRVTGQFWGSWGPGWQNKNLSPELQAAGVAGTSKIDFDYDLGPAIGGPILRNKLWYFTAYRKKGTQQTIFNTFNDDGTPLHSRNGWYQDVTGRLTYQATKANKVNYSYEGNGARPGTGKNGNCSGANPLTATAACSTLYPIYAYQTSVKWTSTPTNRLLVEGLFGKSYVDANNGYILRDEVLPFAVSKFDSGTGRRWDAPAAATATASLNHGWTYLYATNAAVSYVTGSHAFKGGMDLVKGHLVTERNLQRGDVAQLTFINSSPSTVGVMNTPYSSHTNMEADLGLYAQDTWTMRRMTFSLGLRYNYLNESIPAQSAPAGTWVPAREFNAIRDVPKWSDWMPRVGVAYDLFGNGKTALKVSAGKFVGQEPLALVNTFNPLSSQLDTRSWTDRDGNGTVFQTGTFIPQLNEVGASRNSNFGSAAGVPTLDPNLERPYNWSYSVTIQHELVPRVAVSGGYYRREFYNQSQTINRAVDRIADYTPFTFVGPLDARLPGGGGEIITLYNLNPGKLGAVDNFVTYSAINKNRYNGLEVNVNGRLKNGGLVFGGITVGRTETNLCDVPNPNDLRFCDAIPPYQEIYKLGWNYPLPFKFAINGSYQQIPGSAIQANYAVNSALAGVALTGGGALTVKLVDPAKEYLADVKTIDMRISRTFASGQARTKAFVDLVNAPNFSTILAQSTTYGSTWLQPTAATAGRYVRLGLEFTF